MHRPIWAFDCRGVPANYCACSSGTTCIAVHCLSALASNSSTPDTIEHNPSTCITIKLLPAAKHCIILPPGAALYALFFEQDARLAVMYICDAPWSVLQYNMLHRAAATQASSSNTGVNVSGTAGACAYTQLGPQQSHRKGLGTKIVPQHGF